MAEWENIPDDIENWMGFIYRIDRLNAKEGEPSFYIGLKNFHKTIKLPPKKGKTRKRKKRSESDWKDYYGSSEQLKADVLKFGKENFKRTILKLCSCKWQLKYEELVLQVKHNVLLREDSYNSMMNVRIGKVPRDLKEIYKKAIQ